MEDSDIFRHSPSGNYTPVSSCSQHSFSYFDTGVSPRGWTPLACSYLSSRFATPTQPHMALRYYPGNVDGYGVMDSMSVSQNSIGTSTSTPTPQEGSMGLHNNHQKGGGKSGGGSDIDGSGGLSAFTMGGMKRTSKGTQTAGGTTPSLVAAPTRSPINSSSKYITNQNMLVCGKKGNEINVDGSLNGNCNENVNGGVNGSPELKEGISEGMEYSKMRVSSSLNNSPLNVPSSQSSSTLNPSSNSGNGSTSQSIFNGKSLTSSTPPTPTPVEFNLRLGRTDENTHFFSELSLENITIETEGVDGSKKM